MKRHLAAYAAAFLLCLCLSASTFAQVNAILGGTVSDSTGALIPGVEVTAKNVNTGITTTRITNETGAYDFPSLQPGSYTVSAALVGFQLSTYNNVQLGQGQQVRLNFTLQVGGAAQQLEVVTEADTLLATTSASVGNVLPDRDVLSLPLASRNVLDMVATTVGVVNVVNQYGAVVPQFGGAPIADVNTTRDGLVTNDGRYNSSNGAYSAIFTSPDMVEEVRVSSNSIDPALGRGSAQVQMRTRAGGNDFHGAAFYTNNNSAFNAQGWFQDLVGAQKSYSNRNQFGARLGGPIKKNKAFFFILTDDQRYLEKVNLVASVLTPNARSGIFQYLTQGATGANGGVTRRNGNAFSTTPSVTLGGQTLTADPATGAPLFMNTFNLFSDVNDPNRTKIDTTWFGPQYLTRMPLPNDWTVGDGLNTAGFRWLQPHAGSDGATGESPNTNRNHLTARLDYQINSNNKLTYTMTREKNWGVTGQTGLPDFPLGVFGQVTRNPDFYTVAWTDTLSPTVLNEFRFGVKRDPWQGTSPFDRDCCWSGASATSHDAASQQMVDSFPSAGNGSFLYVGNGLGLGTYAPFGTSSPRQSISPFTQYADTVSFTKSAHSFQAGFEFDFAASHQANHGSGSVGTTRPIATLGVGNNPVPNLTTTTFKGLNSSDVTTAQNLLANLAGSIASIQEEFFVNSPTQTQWLDYRDSILYFRDLHENDWDFFFKDNWKVSKNFTLNIGVRYDKYGTPYDTTGLGGRPKGGQSGLFGCSGTSFSAMWNPNVGCDLSKLTQAEFAGKDSSNPGKLIYGNDWNNIGPSVGFSWSLPWFKRNTILRGGYGINYAGAADFLSYSANIGNLGGSTVGVTYTPPSTSYIDVTNVVKANLLPVPTGGSVPYSPVPLTNRTTGLVGYADNRVTPYIESFNLSLQRELTRSLTLDISWVGNKSAKLFSATQINDTNIFENGFLDAFNVTRNGGNAPLFDKILNGLNVTGVGVVNGTTLTGSQALRRFTTTNQFIANGEVGALANFFNTSSALTTLGNGGLLRNGGLPENFFVVNPQFGSVTLEGNNSSSTYHSLQTHLSKRLSHGVTGQASYTFSKVLGDNGVRDERNRQLSKGLLTVDRTHVLVTNATWDLPFGPNRRFLTNAPGVLRRVAEGWQLSSIASWNSGAPLSFTSSRTTDNFRGSNTADLVGALPKNVGDVQVGNGFVQYFSGLSAKAAPVPTFGGDATLPGRFTNQVILDSSGNTVLQNPQPGTTGNTALNLPGVRGPGNLSFSVAMSKQVRISEGRTFTVRADAVNFLNKAQWANPVTDINSTTFGRITAAGGSRTVTINARVDF